MKAIAYNIQDPEKKLLVMANAKRYKLTIISNGLNEDTSIFSAGKSVVIVSELDLLSSSLLKVLKKQGIKKIIIRSNTFQNIDYKAAEKLGIQVLKLDDNLCPEDRAWQIIELLSDEIYSNETAKRRKKLD